ncbi:phosphate/phosphite/phosphonate ABC transporter substrate-binding protein [Desulfosporosinus fructosivorans]|uniref:Phosphate/phosphite/phosphonate ABC transporter substrate-binding protein n=1 Tax=Desulfosporosinus fructosivorans TaxID=2018669 RepID=A0A4Z0R549_9FIRM|nr:phosphate/phosphite/phosphonate ABC transporter substrate-binding protein [Desulfosporosinus fructosivorans]TGE37137.1 phosphate/phosphite/phosphonate ABC transporter substrate-binding protein [Desulfosporosinus fructosivorans]
MSKFGILKKLVLVVLSLSILVTGCGQSQSAIKEQTKSTEAIKKIRIGLSPDEDSAAVLLKYQQFVSYLSKKTGLQVEPFVGADYTAVVEALNSGQLDVAWFGPSEYVLATDVVKSGVEAFASAVQAEGTVPYRSIFITRTDSQINGLADMSGKSIAFTDPASTSGHIFGRYSLVQQGYKPDEYFKQLIYSGSHDACLLAVKNKQVDVAVISSRKLPGFIKSGIVAENEIKTVFESVEIPEDPITYRKDLPQDVKDKLKAAFFDSTGELATSLEGTGFAKFNSADDKSYDLVRKAFEVSGLKPKL